MIAIVNDFAHSRNSPQCCAGTAVHAPQCFGAVLLADRRTDRRRVGDFAHCEDGGEDESGTNETDAESRVAARSARGRASAASRTVATV